MPTAAWFNSAISSLVADYIVTQSPDTSVGINRDACDLSDGTIANRLILRGLLQASSVARSLIAVATVGNSSTNLSPVTANTVMKLGASWNGSSIVTALNGASVTDVIATGMPAGLNVLTIGGVAAQSFNLNGYIRRVRYWPRVLSDAELQSVTV